MSNQKCPEGYAEPTGNEYQKAERFRWVKPEEHESDDERSGDSQGQLDDVRLGLDVVFRKHVPETDENHQHDDRCNRRLGEDVNAPLLNLVVVEPDGSETHSLNQAKKEEVLLVEPDVGIVVHVQNLFRDGEVALLIPWLLWRSTAVYKYSYVQAAILVVMTWRQ